jgi:hypothetical protein
MQALAVKGLDTVDKQGNLAKPRTTRNRAHGMLFFQAIGW